MKNDLTIFEDYKIRRLYDEEKEKWFFSVVDIMQALLQQPDYQTARNYWRKLKERLKKEGSEVVRQICQLKLPTTDGKKYLTDVADAETILRLTQSVPSPKATNWKILTLTTHLKERKTEVEETLKEYFSNCNKRFFPKTSCEYHFGVQLKKVLGNKIIVQTQIKILNYRVDFLLPEFNIIVEYDEEHHDTPSNKKLDKERDYKLISLGYKVIRVNKDDDIFESIGKVNGKILELLLFKSLDKSDKK